MKKKVVSAVGICLALVLCLTSVIVQAEEDVIIEREGICEVVIQSSSMLMEDSEKYDCTITDENVIDDIVNYINSIDCVIGEVRGKSDDNGYYLRFNREDGSYSYAAFCNGHNRYFVTEDNDKREGYIISDEDMERFGEFLISLKADTEDVIAYAVPYVFEGVNETISRGDCLASIMKLIGLRQETADRYFDVDFYKPVFADEYDDPNYLYNYGYILYAQSYGVATGTYADALHAYKFEPNRDVTIKECLAFMLRCLKDAKSVEWENIMSDAGDMGLLTREEAQKFSGDEALDCETFKNLLERMLNQKRYLYCPQDLSEVGQWDFDELQIDLTGSVTYMEWIKESWE